MIFPRVLMIGVTALWLCHCGPDTPAMPDLPGLPGARITPTPAPHAGSTPASAVPTTTALTTSATPAADPSTAASAEAAPAAPASPDAVVVAALPDPPSVVAAPASAPPAACILNEVLYDLVGSDTNGELFIELLCTPGAEIGGWAVRLVNGDDGTLVAGLTLPPALAVPDSGLVVLADSLNGNAQQSQVAHAQWIANFDPQNGPDSVQLFDAQSVLRDALLYGGLPKTLHDAAGTPLGEGNPAGKVPSGQSLSRLEGDDTDDNAADFHSGPPTPGVL